MVEIVIKLLSYFYLYFFIIFVYHSTKYKKSIERKNNKESENTIKEENDKTDLSEISMYHHKKIYKNGIVFICYAIILETLRMFI